VAQALTGVLAFCGFSPRTAKLESFWFSLYFRTWARRPFGFPGQWLQRYVGIAGRYIQKSAYPGYSVKIDPIFIIRL
jgi:hypothetical protein